MATISWAIFCDRVEWTNGKASLMEMFDAVLVRSVPATQKKLCLVVRVLVRPMEKVKLASQVRAPSGRPLARLEEEFAVAEPGTDHHNGLFKFDDLPLPELGQYLFEIFVNDKQAHRVPLSVILLQ